MRRVWMRWSVSSRLPRWQMFDGRRFRVTPPWPVDTEWEVVSVSDGNEEASIAQ